VNFATLDRMIVAAMEWQDLESGCGTQPLG